MDQVKIGQFIAECRKGQGMTQRQLAERLEISDKTVSKWECGNGLPEITLMLPLCEALQINVNELLSGEKLSTDDYSRKAEENMMKLIQTTEEQGRRRKRALTGFLFYGIAVLAMMTVLTMMLTPDDMWRVGHYLFEPVNLGILLGVLLLFLAGSGSIRLLWNAFGIAAGRPEENPAVLRSALAAVRFAGDTLLYAGLFISLFYLIVMLHSMDNPAAIGPYLSSGLSAAFYGITANLLLLPVKNRLAAQIREKETIF